MQTFLPLADYTRSAAVLDNKRLGKQRLEGLQILNALIGRRVSGWASHPAVRMWAGHEYALTNYVVAICKEWRSRGYNDNILVQVKSIQVSLVLDNADMSPPPWLGDERLHASHRSNLLRKLPVWYGLFGWTEPNDLPYYWPTKETTDG